MALLLSEADVKQILTMPMALAAVEDSFRRLADGSALLHSRQRLHLPGKSYLHYMAAADATSGYMGMKIYTSSGVGLRFLVPLFHVDSGELLALIEADYLGQIRTGAASGVATQVCSRAPDAARIGIIGTGLQSRTQLRGALAGAHHHRRSCLQPQSRTSRTFRKRNDRAARLPGRRRGHLHRKPSAAPISSSLPPLPPILFSTAAGSPPECTSTPSAPISRRSTSSTAQPSAAATSSSPIPASNRKWNPAT